MSLAPYAEAVPAAAVTDRYHALRVKSVVAETADSISIVFDVPAELSPTFAYVAGQFVTLRLGIGAERLLRSYSMSSSPEAGDDLQVTVKRVPGGVVSNWLNNAVHEGDTLEVSSPTGVCAGKLASSAVVPAPPCVIVSIEP